MRNVKKAQTTREKAVQKLEAVFEAVLTLKVTERSAPRRVVLDEAERELREIRSLLRELTTENPASHGSWGLVDKIFERLTAYIIKGLIAPLVCKLLPLRRLGQYIMQIGKTVKLLRVWAGLKQKELAKKVRVSSTYLSAVENDKREPSLSLLKALSQELDIPVGLLFLESTDAFSNVSPRERAKYEKLKDLLWDIQRLRMTRTRVREPTMTYAEEAGNAKP